MMELKLFVKCPNFSLFSNIFQIAVYVLVVLPQTTNFFNFYYKLCLFSAFFLFSSSFLALFFSKLSFLSWRSSALLTLTFSLIVATFFLASSRALAHSSRERLSSHFDGLFCDHMISASKDTTWAAGFVLRSTSKIAKFLSETILEVGTFDAWS